MEERLLIEFKQHSTFRLKEGQRMVHLAMKKVTEEQLWIAPNQIGMRLGNQLLHICGNMTQYIISSLGEQKDNRQRNAEFAAKDGWTKAMLLDQLDTTIAKAIRTIENAPSNAFVKIRQVQGFEFSGLGVVLHAVEHFSYHVGQIAFWVKQLCEEDLGFYRDHNLNQLNK